MKPELPSVANWSFSWSFFLIRSLFSLLKQDLATTLSQQLPHEFTGDSDR